MTNGLTLRTTAVLVALAFGLSFGVQALLGGGSSASTPAANRSVERTAPPDLELVAGGRVPALREPQKRRAHRKAKQTLRKVVKAAPRSTPVPITTPTPVPPIPTATARPVPPAQSAPAPKPQRVAPRRTPASTPTPASGEFDTTGESDTSGDFDSSGEP
jgi:hypothetical protein